MQVSTTSWTSPRDSANRLADLPGDQPGERLEVVLDESPELLHDAAADRGGAWPPNPAARPAPAGSRRGASRYRPGPPASVSSSRAGFETVREPPGAPSAGAPPTRGSDRPHAAMLRRAVNPGASGRRPGRYGVRSAQSTSIWAETVVTDDGNSVNVNTRSHGRLGGLVTAARSCSNWSCA